MDTGWKSYPKNTDERIVVDELIRSKRRTLQLSISPKGRLIVRAPLRMPMKRIRQFVEDNREWIEKHRQRATETKKKALPEEFREGGCVYFLGKPLKLQSWDGKSFCRLEDRLLFPRQLLGKPIANLEQWYRIRAREYIFERLKHYSARTGIGYSAFRITSARRRWGSCSAKDSLNFTWRLIRADPRAIDYVVVHELCHVVHKNHSRNFWKLVESFMPDYREQRQWLKENQFLLDG